MDENNLAWYGKYFKEISGGHGEVKDISGTVYFFSGELETLRLLKHYRGNDRADCGFSENLNTFYFRIEPSF